MSRKSKGSFCFLDWIFLASSALQAFDRSAAMMGAIQGVIMQHHQFTVIGHAHIKLKTPDPFVVAALECEERVLFKLMRSPTVGKMERPFLASAFAGAMTLR